MQLTPKVFPIFQIFFVDPNKRVFDLFVEGEIFKAVDLIVIGGGIGDKAFTFEVAKVVDDGFVSIQTFNIKNNAKLSGIEIIQKEVHTAHAVAQGPYVVVDKDDDGFGVIAVDASKSSQFACVAAKLIKSMSLLIY